MAQNVTVQGASYSAVPAVILPKTGGGTARFTDTSPTTAVDSDVASGKIYFKADGSQSTGTASGGSSKNIQYYLGREEVAATAYTATNVSVKISKAGTYKCAWAMDRNTTSGTNGSRLYKNGTAVGTAHTSWTHNGAECEETLTLAANDVITVYARSRSTSYYVGVTNLICIEQ